MAKGTAHKIGIAQGMLTKLFLMLLPKRILISHILGRKLRPGGNGPLSPSANKRSVASLLKTQTEIHFGKGAEGWIKTSKRAKRDS